MLEINASFTAQQWRIITQKAGESGKDPAEFLTQGLENYAALEDFSSVSPQGVFHPPTVEELLPEGYRIRQEVQLQPVSGKAIELQAGDLLLIRQTEGRQCVDFNAFCTDVVGEVFSAGHTRTQGFRLDQGQTLLSNRMNPLASLEYKSSLCSTDLLGSRCHSSLYEDRFDIDWHTNCHDTLTEAVREYGFHEDDVHDSFNMWMNTLWDSEGNWWPTWNSAPAGDTVILRAVRPIIAVPVICGGSDFSVTSNFGFTPIDVIHAVPMDHEQRHSETKITPGLRPDPHYEAQYRLHPMPMVDVQLEVSRLVHSALQDLVDTRRAETLGHGAVIATMIWYLRRYVPTSSPGIGRYRW